VSNSLTGQGRYHSDLAHLFEIIIKHGGFKKVITLSLSKYFWQIQMREKIIKNTEI